jgi:FAD/FMN-containing dehydrogenase
MIDRHRVEPLRAALAGEVILPADAGFEEGRKIFNAMHDKRPAVIARCRSTADVVAAVDFARKYGLLVAVRSGGHSVAGPSVCADGILIDLSGLKTIEVDAAARTARAGGGVLWGEFDAATQKHGLHTPGGRDDLLSAEVVLADGRVVRASEHENADHFWGIRGGGGNFGIVTEFEYRLHPLGPIVLAGLALWPIERAPKSCVHGATTWTPRPTSSRRPAS